MKMSFKLGLICLVTPLVAFAATASASGLPYAVTNQATNILGTSATLNGSAYNLSSYSNLVYFQWGTTSNYGYQSTAQSFYGDGNFSQNITNLTPNTTYHYRAVASLYGNVYYGQDTTFFTTSYYTGATSYLTIDKKVINLTQGNLNWSNTISARPSDVLSFAVTIQAGSQDLHDVIVRDNLPSNLIYKGSLTVNTTQTSGDIASGISLGTVHAGQVVVVSYQVQVANAANFSYGSTTINNNAIFSSTESSTQVVGAVVTVNNTVVYGASTVSTGLTNNILTDSFFLPLLAALSAIVLFVYTRKYYSHRLS